MERSTIIRHVTLILWNMNITSLKNHETDLYLDCVFCEARRGRRRTAVHYEASVRFDERDRVVYFWDHVTLLKSGHTRFSGNRRCYKYCTVINPNARNERSSPVTFHLAEIPVMMRTIARDCGWRFRLVSTKEKALYPSYIRPVCHAKAISNGKLINSRKYQVSIVIKSVLHRVKEALVS